MAQQRFSSSQQKISPEKLMSSPVFESLQSDNMPLEADSKILYANPFAGVEPVAMPADLKEIFNDPNITLTAPNFRAQLEQLMNQYDSDAGPWYVDGSDGLLLIHNKKLTDKTETLYRWQDENGEVLKVQITTNWVSAGSGQSMVHLGGVSKGIYGTTNLDPTLDDVLDKYGSQETSPKDGLNITGHRSAGNVQFATSIQKTNRYPAIKHEPEPVIRTMDGTSSATLIQRERAANAHAINYFASNELFLQKVTDAIQQLILISGLTGVQTGLLRVQLLDYIKTGKVGSVLGLIINKEIPLADKTICRFTHASRLPYVKVFYIKGGKATQGKDMILEDIKGHIKNSASSMVGKSRDRGVAEWKINGTWYTDAEITVMARRQLAADGSGRMGYSGAPGKSPRGVPYNAQRYIEQTAKEASTRFFISNATIQGADVKNYGDRIVVKVDISGYAPVKVTVRDMINLLAQREGSPVAMIKQANALRNANKRAKRKEIEMQMLVIGNPLLEAGQSLVIENIGKKYSGLWHIKTCIHKLDSNGFTTSLTLNKGAGTSGVTVSSVSDTQSTGAKNKGKGTGTKSTITPNRTDNWNSGDIALLEGVGATAQTTGTKEDQQAYNEMVELMKYASEHSSTGEPLYEIDTSEFVYNYPTEHLRPGDKRSPKVKMTKKGKELYEQMVRERAAEARRQAKATAQALRNKYKLSTALPRLSPPSNWRIPMAIPNK